MTPITLSPDLVQASIAGLVVLAALLACLRIWSDE